MFSEIKCKRCPKRDSCEIRPVLTEYIEGAVRNIGPPETAYGAIEIQRGIVRALEIATQDQGCIGKFFGLRKIGRGFIQ